MSSRFAGRLGFLATFGITQSPSPFVESITVLNLLKPSRGRLRQAAAGLIDVDVRSALVSEGLAIDLRYSIWIFRDLRFRIPGLFLL